MFHFLKSDMKTHSAMIQALAVSILIYQHDIAVLTLPFNLRSVNFN